MGKSKIHKCFASKDLLGGKNDMFASIIFYNYDCEVWGDKSSESRR
jgi:hypothetical protein